MSLTEEPKMPVFTFGGIGINSYGGINSLKGLKQPCGSRSLQGKML